MNSLPRISIITPSYNQAQFLEETIRSVLEQGYPNLEYIIIDGGSTDNSVEIIRKYENRLAYWVSEPDRGQSHAINKGFQKATGEILSWLNSDDVYLLNTLWIVGRFFANHPEVDVVYGGHLDIDEKGKIFREARPFPFFSRWGLLSRGGAMCQPATFFRRKVLDKVGYLDESLVYNMDYDFFLRMAFTGCKIVPIPHKLVNFRYHPSSKTVLNKTVLVGHEQSMREIQSRYVKINGCNELTLRTVRWCFRVALALVNGDNYIKHAGYYAKRTAQRFVRRGNIYRF